MTLLTTALAIFLPFPGTGVPQETEVDRPAVRETLETVGGPCAGY